MSLKISRAIRHLCEPKLIVSVTAALMLSACSNAMERFAENPLIELRRQYDVWRRTVTVP